MKKFITLTIAAFAIANAAVSQTEVKDSIWAAKEAAKAKKAQDAADLKAFKEKQKADLAAFIEAQKSGKSAQSKTEFQLEKPAMANPGDSLGYIFGIAQSKGLKAYITNQFGVDDAHIASFAQGVLDRANLDPNDKEKSSYSAGNQIGERIVQMAKQFSDDYYSADEGMSISPAIVANGLITGLLEKNEMPLDSASRYFQTRITKRQAENKEKQYGPNRAAGEKFLEENRTKPGVVTTASGLQYKILTQGTGNKPAASDKVKVHYEGRLIDGTVFDSSYKRGEPTSFGVKQVIAGWTEALQLMPVGSKWELYIPYQLAYGDRETGKEIKPYSALVFTVELLGIEEAK